MKLFRLASLAVGFSLMISAASTHIYELRTYHANPGKLADLEARFRDHTITIFNKHHMKSVAYWVPTDNKDNVLIYVLEHESQEEAMKNWKEFSADPEWQAVAKASEVNGKLVDHVDRVFMAPTDFSAMK
jgi:cation transport regulator ChaC